MKLSAPSKTFLLGEYAALHGHPALLAATAPRFALHVRDGAGRIEGIDAYSPAGRFLAARRQAWTRHDLRFEDPHAGRGGFGASSAQFLLCHALLDVLAHGRLPALDAAGVAVLRRDYRAVAWDGAGVPPSGADVVAQWAGGMVEVGAHDAAPGRHAWPFADLELHLLSTGSKVPTHRHLAALGDVATDALAPCVRQACEALAGADAHAFVQAVRACAAELARQHLVHAATHALLERLQAIDGVLACKGCGALGADVVLVLATPGTGSALLRAHPAALHVREHDLCDGLAWET